MTTGDFLTVRSPTKAVPTIHNLLQFAFVLTIGSVCSLAWQFGTTSQVAIVSAVGNAHDSIVSAVPEFFTGAKYGYDDPLFGVTPEVAATIIQETNKLNTIKELSSSTKRNIETLMRLSSTYADALSSLDVSFSSNLGELRHASWFKEYAATMREAAEEHQATADAISIHYFNPARERSLLEKRRENDLAEQYREKLRRLERGDTYELIRAYTHFIPLDAAQAVERELRDRTRQFQIDYDTGKYSAGIAFNSKTNDIDIQSSAVQYELDLKYLDATVGKSIEIFPRPFQELILNKIKTIPVRYRLFTVDSALYAEKGRDVYMTFESSVKDADTRREIVLENARQFASNCRENRSHGQCHVSLKLETDLPVSVDELMARGFIVPTNLFEIVVKSLQRKQRVFLTPRMIARLLLTESYRKNPSLTINIAIIGVFIGCTIFFGSMLYGVAWILNRGILGTLMNLVGIMYDAVEDCRFSLQDLREQRKQRVEAEAANLIKDKID